MDIRSGIDVRWHRLEDHPGDGWIKSARQHDQGTVWVKWVGDPNGFVMCDNTLVEHTIASCPFWNLEVASHNNLASMLRRKPE